MIKGFQALATKETAFNTAMHIAQHAGILKELYEDKSVEGISRYENIQELLNGVKEFSEREDIEDRGLDVFMQDIALLTNDDADKDPNADTVSLMTIHSSKGLEFPVVYIVGLEENLFPSQMSLNSRADLEEERRLFYVALTRAERKLGLSYATSRYRWGTLNTCEPSRFLDELDSAYLDLDFKTSRMIDDDMSNFTGDKQSWSRTEKDIFTKPKVRKVKTTSILPKAHTPSAGFTPSDTRQLQIGMDVEHERFGFGKVINMEGNAGNIKATVFLKNWDRSNYCLSLQNLELLPNN